MVILLVLAVLALTIVIPNNVLISNNDQVGLALDWQEAQGVAQAAGVPAAELVQQLQPEGAGYMTVREDTLGRLKQTGRIQVLTGWELYQLTQMLSSEDAAEEEFRLQDTYVLTTNQELFNRLKERLQRRFPDQVRTLAWAADNTYVLAVSVHRDQLTPVGIGISPSEVAAVRALGFEPVLVWLDGAKTLGELKLDLNDVAQLQPAALIPGPLPAAAGPEVGSRLAQLDIVQGVPEFDPPLGAAAVAAAGDYKTVRVYERPVHTIYQEYLLAVRDRNVRLVVLHLLWQVPAAQKGQSLVDANRTHLSRTAAALTAAGMKLGTLQSFPPRQANRAVVAAMLGLTPALFVYRQRWPWMLWVLVGAGTGLVALLVPPLILMWLRKGAALAIAGFLPARAMFQALSTAQRQTAAPVMRGLTALMGSAALTLLGGVVVQGLLGDIDFLLKLHVFSGIKVAYLITFALVLAVAYGEQWRGRRWWQEKQIAPVELLVTGLLGVAVWVLFNRSGNASIIPIPAWELKARSFLEAALFARPRTKEFLVGHPALMLAAAGWAEDKFYRPQLLVLAAVGQASLMNTFVHLHTPVAISLVRSLLGLGGGALVGALLLGVGNFVARRGKRNA